MTWEAARKEMRKLRKKLRQIENLERLERDLNDEEIEKVLKKDRLRAQLQSYLAEYPTDEGSSFNANINNASLLSSSPDDTANTTSLLDQQPEDEEDGEEEEEEEEDEYEEGEDEYEDEEEEEEDEEECKRETSDGDWQTVTSHKEVNPSKTVTKHEKADKAKGDSQATMAKVVPQEKGEKGEERQPQGGKKTSKAKEEAGKAWRKYQWSVVECVGHNDLVCCVAMDEDIMVTGSRDTTVKLWKSSSGQEVRSFGGHSMSVSSILLLPADDAKKLLSALELSGRRDRVVISASHDCNIKVWSTTTGEQLQSIYTYNPVTCLAFIADHNIIISGSDGGKVEAWDVVEGKLLQALKTEEEAAITGLQYCCGYVIASSADGLIRVYQLREQHLHLLYISENIKASAGVQLLRRQIHSLATTPQAIYYGDDGLNIKVLKWKDGEVHKLSNHLGEFGSTDALCVCEDLLLSSGYDLDNGMGYINVRSLPSESYAASLCDEDTGRIVAMAALKTQDGRLRFATAGMELKVWSQTPPESADRSALPSHYLAAYTRPPRHSDVESDNDGDTMWSDSDDNSDSDDTPAPFRRRGDQKDEESEAKGWMSWCTVL